MRRIHDHGGHLLRSLRRKDSETTRFVNGELNPMLPMKVPTLEDAATVQRREDGIAALINWGNWQIVIDDPRPRDIATSPMFREYRAKYRETPESISCDNIDRAQETELVIQRCIQSATGISALVCMYAIRATRHNIGEAHQAWLAKHAPDVSQLSAEQASVVMKQFHDQAPGKSTFRNYLHQYELAVGQTLYMIRHGWGDLIDELQLAQDAPDG